MRLAILFLGGSALWGQATPPVTLEQGRAVFRSSCAFCHGTTGRGGRGPNIATTQLNQGNRDEDLRRVISQGIPGTSMPAFPRMEPEELDGLIRFLRHLQGAGSETQQVAGDPAHGRQVYVKTACSACHRIGSEGSDYGPDLSRVGSARSVEYLKHSITEPAADIPESYQGVAVVTREGKRIRGIRINEDTFTIQFRDMAQKIHMFQKSDLQKIVHETTSMMPAYGKMPARDLNDLIAYLVTLRGEVRSGSDVKEVRGVQ